MPLVAVTGSRPIAREKALQRIGWDSGLAELVGGARGGREAFDGIPGSLRSSMNHRERSRLSRAGGSLQSLNLIAGEQHLFDHPTLGGIQVSVRLRNVNDLLDGGNLLVPILPFDHPCNHFLFGANHLLGRELTGTGMNLPRSNLEFSAGHSLVERGSNFGECQVAHSTP